MIHFVYQTENPPLCVLGLLTSLFRNGHAHFMIRVPLDLVDKFNSQYIRKSLKTSHPSEAKLLASLMALMVMSVFPFYAQESSQKNKHRF